MNNIPYNIVNKNVNKDVNAPSFKGLFTNIIGKNESKEREGVFPYDKYIELKDYSTQIVIPQNSIINLRNKYNIDLTSKSLKAQIKYLKDGEAVIIGRAQINPEDATISRKQFLLEKAGDLLYLSNLSSRGTQFKLIKPNNADKIGDYPAPYIKKESENYFLNLDPEYLKSRYGQKNINFRQLLDMKYDEIRMADYPYSSTFVSDSLEGIQNAINQKPRNGLLLKQEGWNFRVFNCGFANNVKERISLNVKADPNLIKDLDELMITGRYTDINGNMQRVPSNKQTPGCYKTYSNAKNWAGKHDPITMYFKDNVSKEMLRAICDISQKYARKSQNDVPLLGAIPSKPWVGVQKEVTEAQVNELALKAEKLNEHLSNAIMLYCYRHWNWQQGYYDFIVSSGKFEAVKMVMKEYEAYTKLK